MGPGSHPKWEEIQGGGSGPGEARRTAGFPCPQQGRLEVVLAPKLEEAKGQ